MGKTKKRKKENPAIKLKCPECKGDLKLFYNKIETGRTGGVFYYIYECGQCKKKIPVGEN